MARAGDVIHNHVTGERIRFLATAADTGGALLRLEVTLRPGGAVPMTHRHPRQEERFVVLAGTGRFRLGRKTAHAGPGEELVAAAGVPHRFWNDGCADLVVQVEFRPALRTEPFLVELWQGPLTRRGLPKPRLAMRLAAQGYLDEVAVPVLPLAVQGAVQSALAIIGRLVEAVPLAVGRRTSTRWPRIR
jgi:mannose-6-phosphate isomerase-like protein (cupin superfamily)